MASLVRPWIVRHHDPKTGKRCPAKTPGAIESRERSATWFGQGVPGEKKRVSLGTSNKRVAQKKLDALVENAERGIVGLPDREQAVLPLEPLVVEFEKVVDRRSDAKHVAAVIGHVRAVLTACRLSILAHLQADGVADRVETYVWELTEGDHAVAAPTACYVGKHVKSFTRWLWRKKHLLKFDPLAGIDLPSQETVSARRALSPAELESLDTATAKSVRVFRGLAGEDRALLYLVAAATGYRAGELAQLTPDHFRLDAEIPIARLESKATKNKKQAEQPIPPWLVARLRIYLAGRPVDRVVWRGTWASRGSDMLKIDLEAAGIPIVIAGEVATFHSLRHSYTSLLVRTATVKVVQELSRHSTPNITIGRYGHSSLSERAEAVARLPLPGATTAGPFSGMPRAELERLAESLVVGLVAAVLVAPVVAPNLDRTRGDVVATGGESDPQPKAKGKKKPPGNPSG